MEDRGRRAAAVRAYLNISGDRVMFRKPGTKLPRSMHLTRSGTRDNIVRDLPALE